MSPFSHYRFRPAESQHMSALGTFADRYFQSDAFPGGLTGRINYFSELHDHNRDVFRVLEYRHPSGKQSWKIVGYSSIMPELRPIALKHRAGQFNQYRLEPSHIFGTHDPIPNNHPPQFFAQAVAIGLTHRVREEVQSLRNEMLISHLAALMRNYTGTEFRILAEAFTTNGRAFMDRLSFQKLDVVSPTNHELYRLRSEDIPKFSEASAWLAELKRLRSAQAAA